METTSHRHHWMVCRVLPRRKIPIHQNCQAQGWRRNWSSSSKSDQERTNKPCPIHLMLGWSWAGMDESNPNEHNNRTQPSIQAGHEVQLWSQGIWGMGLGRNHSERVRMTCVTTMSTKARRNHASCCSWGMAEAIHLDYVPVRAEVPSSEGASVRSLWIAR